MAYVFPLPDWHGSIELHWGTDPGAADLMGNVGLLVVAMTDGTVGFSGQDSLGGNAVEIDGDDGLSYYYAHLRDLPLVNVGDRVVPGTPIGYLGDTGNAAGGPPHLHIGIGHGIATGSGPHGGAGNDFDAVTFLRAIYAGADPGTYVGSGYQPVGDSGSDSGGSSPLGVLSFLAGIIKWLAGLVTGAA